MVTLFKYGKKLDAFVEQRVQKIFKCSQRIDLDSNVEIVQENELQTVQVIQDGVPQIQEEMVLTLQEDGSVHAANPEAIATAFIQEEEDEEPLKRITQKQFLAGNAYVKCQKTGPLNP